MQVFMERALELALKGSGQVAPNPMVGCAIVYDGKIIGEGWHQKYGTAHAEINAINSVKHPELLPHSEIYVTLEPCSHFGKTPPCANRIIEEKIPKVVIASFDPNPLVAGKGIELLRKAGLEVVTGFMQAEADFLNRRFMTFHLKKRPYVIAKWAQSADGFMDPERLPGQKGSVAISGTAAAWYNHYWRSSEQAILVGAGTVLTDNPSLTTRLVPGKNPLRVVIDPDLRVPRNARIFENGERTFVFNRLETRTLYNIERIQLDFREDVLVHIMNYLHYEGILSVIVEGGQKTLQRFLAAGIVDEIRRITATNTFLLNGLKAPEIPVEITPQQIIRPDKNDRIEFFYLP